MTSEQVMLTVATLALSGCSFMTPPPTPVGPLVSPYTERQVWAVAPLFNDSGTLAADGTILADRLAQRLENASNIDVLPVNRVLAALEALGMTQASSPAEALKLMQALGADALVVGTITAYDPYDPPKLGMALELYAGRRTRFVDPVDVRRLTQAATDQGARPGGPSLHQPVSVVSAYFDAADPQVEALMKRYAVDRAPPPHASAGWRLYRINMDLFSEFVSYAMSRRLLEAETQRVTTASAGPAP